MAGAMRKMAVYLGLVEDDHRYDDRYQDKYDSDEEYDEYDDDPDRADAADRQEARAGRADVRPRTAATLGLTGVLTPSSTPPTWRGSRRCIRARTTRPGRSASTSVRERP